METELKEMLQGRADTVEVDRELPKRIRRRARRRRIITGAVSATAAAAVVVGAFVGIQAAIHHRAAPSTSPSPTTSGTGGAPPLFRGFWLAASPEDLADLQREADKGVIFLGTDPEELARRFVYVEMGWREAAVSSTRTAVSPTEVRIDLWNLAVTKRAGADAHDPALATTLTLAQLGKTGPSGVWEVTDVRSGLIEMRCPSPRQDVLEAGSTQKLCGTLAWTPAEGRVDAVAYVNDLPAKEHPSPPSASGNASISFPNFEGSLEPLPSGDSAILLVRLVDPEGTVLGMVARKMAVEPTPAPTSPEALPQAVVETKKLIAAAAVRQDYEALAALIDEDTFSYSFGESGDPIGYWKRLETQGEVPILGDILRVVLLGTHPAKNGDVYMWPGAAAKDPSLWTEQDLEDMRHLYDAAAIRGFRKYGSYIGYRVGIREDGAWLFFVGGD